jgi:hypothetical protein
MLGNLRRPLTPPTIEPRPLHNEDGSLRALIGQMLMDLDHSRVETPVQTETLAMILNRLREFLADAAPAAKLAAEGAVTEAARNPNLLYWQARADEDADRPEPDAEP